MAMLVRAVKPTKDVHSFKIVYEKNGTLYMRSGADAFQRGVKVRSPLVSLLNKQGFRSVDEAPTFRDAGDIIDNFQKFEVGMDGSVTYQG